MRMTLQNYLSVSGHSIGKLALKMGLSRETIRRWREDKALTLIVDFDPATNKVRHIEKGGVMKIVKPKAV